MYSAAEMVRWSKENPTYIGRERGSVAVSLYIEVPLSQTTTSLYCSCVYLQAKLVSTQTKKLINHMLISKWYV